MVGNTDYYLFFVQEIEDADVDGNSSDYSEEEEEEDEDEEDDEEEDDDVTEIEEENIRTPNSMYCNIYMIHHLSGLKERETLFYRLIHPDFLFLVDFFFHLLKLSKNQLFFSKFKEIMTENFENNLKHFSENFLKKYQIFERFLRSHFCHQKQNYPDLSTLLGRSVFP